MSSRKPNKSGPYGKKHSGRPRTDRSGQQRILSPAMDMERAERLREVLSGLAEINRLVPVVVEGKKDARALSSLGFDGKIITLHSGKGMYEFSEELNDNYDKLVLLLDWDEKGEQLTRTLEQYLKGRWEEFSPLREMIKAICQKDIKDIEGIPSLLKRLEGFAGANSIERTGQQG
ncbi:MAG: toprim domain-containing protein [Nitrospiraceae bacterium]|nr:toprim domain-containing protein [Nitrospiraceae bacterium]